MCSEAAAEALDAGEPDAVHHHGVPVEHGDAVAFEDVASHSRPSGGAESVAVPRLDAAEEVRRLQPTFLIVDIEGSEREIVPAIDWSPVEKLLLELHPQRFEPGDENRIRDHLLAEGFHVDPIVSSRRKLLLSR